MCEAHCGRHRLRRDAKHLRHELIRGAPLGQSSLYKRRLTPLGYSCAARALATKPRYAPIGDRTIDVREGTIYEGAVSADHDQCRKRRPLHNLRARRLGWRGPQRRCRSCLASDDLLSPSSPMPSAGSVGSHCCNVSQSGSREWVQRAVGDRRQRAGGRDSRPHAADPGRCRLRPLAER